MTKQDILDSLWVEKYRPRRIEDMALPPEHALKLQEFLSQGAVPHILFEGPPGTGKTATSQIIIRALDCDALMLNASDDRGIGVIRNKIKAFASMMSLKKWKVVFLDEMDRLTPEAQDSLKSIIERYASMTRFIGTCNYVTRLDPAIRSRFQIFTFNAYPKEKVKEIMRGILTQEKMGYEDTDLTKHVDLCYPDLRRTINEMQQNIRSGRFQYYDRGEVLQKIVVLIKAKNVKELRQVLANSVPDYPELYRYIYDNIAEFPQKARLTILLNAAEYLYRDATIPDKEINFIGFVVKSLGALGE